MRILKIIFFSNRARNLLVVHLTQNEMLNPIMKAELVRIVHIFYSNLLSDNLSHAVK